MQLSPARSAGVRATTVRRRQTGWSHTKAGCRLDTVATLYERDDVVDGRPQYFRGQLLPSSRRFALGTGVSLALYTALAPRPAEVNPRFQTMTGDCLSLKSTGRSVGLLKRLRVPYE